MAFNGSGVFVRLYSWVNDAAANIKIRADRMDNEMNGMAVGLSTCITKDGQTTITANLPMAGYRHTGVGDAQSRTQYASFSQVQDGNVAWADGGGTADAITAAYNIPITTLVDGQLCYVRATAANATTTPTFSPNSLTARTIVKQGGTALAVGDIKGDGQELILRYDLANTRWELLNPAVTAQSIPYTAASASGPATLDFAEDTDNGTNKIVLSAPSSIASDVTVTLPSSAGTLVLSTGLARVNGFRLTLTTGVPVTTTDVTGATTIYCTPYTGNQISLYDGTNWNLRTSSEFSLGLGTLTSGKPYDVFCYDNAGTPTLEFLIWTNDTTRATALVYQDGVLVKSGATTRRYLGTFYTTSTTTTEDSVANRYLWNYYHRVTRVMRALEAANGWVYTTATIRQANANTANQLNFVVGVDESAVTAEVLGISSNTNVGVDAVTGIGLDTTTAFTSTCIRGFFSSAVANEFGTMNSSWKGNTGVGKHYLAWLEYSEAVGTTTWQGDGGAGTLIQAGIHGIIFS